MFIKMNIFIFAAIISFSFFVMKFVELRFISKQDYPFKLLAKDTMYVFASVIVGNYVMEQFSSTLDTDVINNKGEAMKPQVFLGNPDF